MKEEIKTKWLEALRSGKYKQGRTCLRNSDVDTHEYCCLGVLCDLYKDTEGGNWTDHDSFVDNRGNWESVYLPLAVIGWAGLSDNNPEINEITDQDFAPTSLAGANDYGLSFLKIADIIEKEL